MPRKSEGPRLRQRPNRKQWFIRYIDPATGRQRDQSTGTEDRREAEIKLAEFLLGWAEPPEARMRRNGMLIAEALARYGYYKEKAGSVERFKYSMKRLLPFWGHRMVNEIDEELILDYLLANPGRPRGTLRRELSDLRASVNYVTRKRFVNPIDFPELPRDSDPKQNWLLEDQFAQLLWCARNITKSRYNLITFLMIAFYTGARKSAIMDLEWKQVDFKNGEINFLKEDTERSNIMDEQSNKRKARTPMAAQLHRHLRFRAQQFGQRSSFVFHRENAPHAHVKSVDRGFEKAVEMAGLSGITPHSLRHTRASLMIRGGVHMKVISEILDMSIETLNKVYAHVSRDELNAMSSWMGRTATMRSQNVRTTLDPIRKNTRKFAKS